MDYKEQKREKEAFLSFWLMLSDVLAIQATLSFSFLLQAIYLCYIEENKSLNRISSNQIISPIFFVYFQRFFMKDNQIKMQKSTEDFFGTVSSLIDVSDLQGDRASDTSITISNGSFLSINDNESEHLGHRLIKRKPSKNYLKPSKNVELNSNYTNAFKIKLLNSFVQSKDQCLNVDAQLNRLQKTLVTSKSNKKLLSGSRSGRLLKKMAVQKQNLLPMTQKIEVTSEQLHSLHDQDEEIKQILLTLARFQEQQSLQNDQLQLQIQSLSNKIQQSKHMLNKQISQLGELKSHFAQQTRKIRKQQYQILKRKVNDAQNY